MKQSERLRDLDAQYKRQADAARMVYTAANPQPPTALTLDGFMATVTKAAETLGKLTEQHKVWLLIAPDGRTWAGPDPLTLAAQAMPLSDYFSSGGHIG